LPGNVLIIVENLPVPFDRRVWLESTALREAGYSVTVISPQGRGYEREDETIDGVRILRHPLNVEASSAAGFLGEYSTALKHEFRLARVAAKKQHFDVVHICNPPDLLFLVARYFKLFHRAKVIFDHHDLNPELYEAKFGRRDFFYRALLRAERATFATADRVIATNESYREVALTRGKIRPEHVVVVRSAPEMSRFEATAGNEVYRRGRKHLVGYLGVMGHQEGLDILLRIVDDIVHRQGREDIHFCLIGDGVVREEMERLAARLEVSDWVEFTRRIPDVEVIDRLSTCDLCVNPEAKTPFNDKSTMNKLMEYMSLKRPIVQFDLTEGRRSCGEGSLYVPPGDERAFAELVVQLVDDPERQAELGREGRRRMETELAWDHQKPRLLSLYRSLLDSPAPSRA
jgi:glycosyltransferase involved in cell wall biosynthesis